MNANLKALIQACELLGIAYRTHHRTQNLVEVCLAEQSYLFVNWTTPLNSQSIRQLCRDKDYFYHFFAQTIRMPTTMAFLNPACNQKYTHYLQAKSIAEITAIVEQAFSYPMIVKKNSGSWGTNVFRVDHPMGLDEALRVVFDLHSAAYDYIALVQELIQIHREYRVVYLHRALAFAYEKSTDGARYTGNLSPLHWENAKAIPVSDPVMLQEIDMFCQPLFERLAIPFCGLDIARDRQGEWWLIEANSSPGFDHLIAAGGEPQVIQLYQEMLLQLRRLHPTPTATPATPPNPDSESRWG